MRNLVFVLLCALALAACTSQPIYNVEKAPVPKATTEEVKGAILRAGAGLGWLMKPVSEGLITGTMHQRDHIAMIDIRYDAQQYSITYRDSSNLNFAGTTIHRGYNEWVQSLDRAIRTHLEIKS